MAIIAARPHPPTKKVGGYSLCRTFRKQLMPALGQKQTSAAQKVMSALPPKTDMCGAFVVAIRLRKAHAERSSVNGLCTRRDDFTASTPNRGNHMSNPDQGGQQNQGGQQDQKPGQQQQNPGQGGQQQGDQKPGQQEQQK